MTERFVDLFYCDTPVRTAEKEDAVFAGRDHLDHGVSLKLRNFPEIIRIDAGLFQRFLQHFTAFSDAARVINFCAGFCERHRLVQPFSARGKRLSRCRKRLAGAYKMVHIISIIQVQ